MIGVGASDNPARGEYVRGGWEVVWRNNPQKVLLANAETVAH